MREREFAYVVSVTESAVSAGRSPSVTENWAVGTEMGQHPVPRTESPLSGRGPGVVRVLGRKSSPWIAWVTTGLHVSREQRSSACDVNMEVSLEGTWPQAKGTAVASSHQRRGMSFLSEPPEGVCSFNILTLDSRLNS